MRAEIGLRGGEVGHRMLEKVYDGASAAHVALLQKLLLPEA